MCCVCSLVCTVAIRALDHFHCIFVFLHFIFVAYSQAPASMKSLCQATWLLTVAVGNLLVMIIASLQLFESKAYEFIFYSILVVVAALVFAAMAMRYHYVEDRDVPVNDVDEEDEEVVDTDVSVGVDEDVAPETALLASDAKED